MGLFAVAVLVAAVLFADRLGPSEELHRRFYQVGLSLAAVLFVLALAAVVVPVATPESQDSNLGDLGEAAGKVLRERVSIAVGAGLLIFLAGMYQSASVPTLSVGFMLAGLILLASFVTDTTSNGLISAYYQAELDGGEARNAAFAAVTGLGLAMMLLYGYQTWERPESPEMEEEEESV